MPQISIRGHEMPESPIRKLAPFADEAKRKGRKVYHLNIGQPDIHTPEVALDAVKTLEDKVIEYSPSVGNESYRRKLAGYYQGLDISVDYTQILITTGGSEAISFALMSTLNPGDEVIVPEPYYANYNGFTAAAQVKVIPVTSYIEDDFKLPPVGEFEKLITPKTKGIIINNPNNPTGYLYSQEELEQLGEIIGKHDLYLFSDEVYREFCYDGHPHFSAMHLNGIDQNVILIDSVSKRYSACGVRIGAMVTKNKEVFNTALKFAQARLSPPSLGQVLGEAALDTPNEYFEEVYNEYIERRDYMVSALNKMDGVICPTPGGAFYTIAQLPVNDTDVFCQWLLSDFEWNNQTVMMAPASGFYSNPEAGKKQVRIAYVLNKEDLKKAMECLEEGLRKYN
ncbi:MAG: pyridoxal phosphate-dependent aminotransferase [Deltaproteobacteria bacterium]|nr:pyridoxal phosphate-dependent aminotransferase [Deltaproteobacteria bacterium]